MRVILFALLPLLLLTACSGSKSIGGDERTISQQVKDDNLAAAAIDKIVALPIYERRKMRVHIIPNNGYLLLIGQVNSENASQQIAAAAEQITGVKSVYNQLRIGSTIGPLQQAQDSWLTSKVKSQLAADKEVSSLKIKVVTENSEVFLIGNVSQQMSDVATQITRKISGVKQVVRVFEIIK